MRDVKRAREHVEPITKKRKGNGEQKGLVWKGREEHDGGLLVRQREKYLRTWEALTKERE